MPSHIPEHAQTEAAQLLTLLRTFVQQDTDRGIVATNIPSLADALLDFEQTLRVMQPVVNDCDGCGEPAAMRVCDEDDEEFFICNAAECAEWAAPTQIYNTTDACWCNFDHFAPRKHPRLSEADKAEIDRVLSLREEEPFDEEEEFDEEGEFDEEELEEEQEPTPSQAAMMAADEEQFLRSHAHLWKDDEGTPI